MAITRRWFTIRSVIATIAIPSSSSYTSTPYRLVSWRATTVMRLPSVFQMCPQWVKTSPAFLLLLRVGDPQVSASIVLTPHWRVSSDIKKVGQETKAFIWIKLKTHRVPCSFGNAVFGWNTASWLYKYWSWGDRNIKMCFCPSELCSVVTGSGIWPTSNLGRGLGLDLQLHMENKFPSARSQLLLCWKQC